ncbi:MAG: exosortase/archaeosortase family protein [Planctomycetota bacterium]
MRNAREDRVAFGCAIAVGVALLVAYGAELSRLASRWWGNQDYIHGFLVIPFAVYLAYQRRSMMRGFNPKGDYAIGSLLIGLAVLMRCVSAYVTDPVLAPLSIPFCVGGVACILGGRNMLAWLWPTLVILPFMIPLPDFMASWGNLALQRVATVSSTFILQTLGVPVASFGNVIVLTDAELGVEEACSGLRSTVLFFAVSVGAAFLIEGTPERIVAVLIAIPAAIIANTIRIVATGLLYQYSTTELAEAVFHDFFGFLMLPLAAAMVMFAVRLTTAVLPEISDDTPISLGKMSVA